MRNIVVVTFSEPSKAYQALSVVKQLDIVGLPALYSAVVVERPKPGKAVVRDYTDRMPPFDMPLGVVGRMVDGLNGMDETVEIAERITVGTTGLMAEIGEQATEAFDEAMNQLGGKVYRQSHDEVIAAFSAAEHARREAEKAEERAEREQRRLEGERKRAERHNLRIDRTKARLGELERWLEEQREPVATQ